MKTNFPHTRIQIHGAFTRPQSMLSRRAGVVVFLLGALLLLATPFGEFLAGAFRMGVEMGAGFMQGVSPVALWRERTALLDDLAAARADLAAREGKDLALGAIAADLAELRRAFRRADEGGVLAGSTVAAVLARPPRIAYDTILIDRGVEHGARVGAAVFAASEAYLGAVVRADAQSSLVELASSPGKETDALLGSALIPVTAIGAGGGMVTLSLPNGIAVEPGDELRLSSFEDVLVGIVGDVEREEASSFVTVRARLPLSLAALRFVYVAN